MKHHMKEILDLAGKNQCGEIAAYIGKMNDCLHLSSNVVDSGNNLIDGILNYMIAQAEEAGISVVTHIVVPETIELCAFDRNIILGNLLDNAKEAAVKSSAPEIMIDIKYNQECLFITASNTYAGKIQKVNGRLVSSKDDSRNHGIGLANIQKAVEKYHGELQIKYDDKYFTVNAILFIPTNFAV